jgi:hypothetical protein
MATRLTRTTAKLLGPRRGPGRPRKDGSPAQARPHTEAEVRGAIAAMVAAMDRAPIGDADAAAGGEASAAGRIRRPGRVSR